MASSVVSLYCGYSLVRKAVFSGAGMGELFIIFLTKRLLTYFYTHRLYCKFDHFYREQVGKMKSPASEVPNTRLEVIPVPGLKQKVPVLFDI